MRFTIKIVLILLIIGAYFGHSNVIQAEEACDTTTDADCDGFDDTTEDLCLNNTGPLNGCPDDDGDGITEADGEDPCPGDVENNCKVSTPATTTKTTTPPTTQAVTTGQTTLQSPYGDKYVTDPKYVVAVILQTVLGIVGAATLLMFVWGGLRLIFSEGNEDAIEKSRSILVWTTIGLAVILSSYSILSYTFRVIQKAASGAI